MTTKMVATMHATSTTWRAAGAASAGSAGAVVGAVVQEWLVDDSLWDKEAQEVGE